MKESSGKSELISFSVDNIEYALLKDIEPAPGFVFLGVIQVAPISNASQKRQRKTLVIMNRRSTPESNDSTADSSHFVLCYFLPPYCLSELVFLSFIP